MDSKDTGTNFYSGYLLSQNWFLPRSKKGKCKWLDVILQQAADKYFNGNTMDLNYGMIEAEVNNNDKLDLYIEVPKRCKKQFNTDYLLIDKNVPKEAFPAEVTLKYY